jgi:hypothetical protein
MPANERQLAEGGGRRQINPVWLMAAGAVAGLLLS